MRLFQVLAPVNPVSQGTSASRSANLGRTVETAVASAIAPGTTRILATRSPANACARNTGTVIISIIIRYYYYYHHHGDLLTMFYERDDCSSKRRVLRNLRPPVDRHNNNLIISNNNSVR